MGVKVKYGISLRGIMAAALFMFCAWLGWQGKSVFQHEELAQPSIILDAGHGGEDGGAVSLTGQKESKINLEVVRKLDQMLGLLGKAPLLLRDEDISLHDDSAVTLREKKVSDLKNRVEIVNGQPAAALISIHQNSYPEPKYSGTQVFYAPTGGSKQLAEEVQRAITQHLQPENTRCSKEIPESVYLMNHVNNTAILIECGFLTNPTEEKMLQQPDYQRKLAMILAAALAQYIE